MSDESPDEAEDTGADVGHDQGAERVTAPMSEYTNRAVGVGLLVLLVGLAVAFGVPLLAAP